MMHKNARANFTDVCLNLMKHWWDSKSNHPLAKLLIVEGLILVIVVLQHLLKLVSIPPQLVSTWMA
jgi:hypothetical protein